MLLTILFYLLKYAFMTLFILFITFFLLLTVSVIWIKLKLEPFKAVCKSTVRLDGKVVLVTGANTGIGLETARDLAGRGARVVIACRNADKSGEAIADITKTTGNTNVTYKHLDLSKFSSIREFADDFNKSFDRLDVLVQNAGCAGLKPKTSEDGIDVVMQINHFGQFLLTNLLLDKLTAAKPSRIVIVSSWLHHFAKLDFADLGAVKEPSWARKYCNSKLYNVLITKAFAKRLPEGVTVNALHPGIVKTDIFSKIYPSVKSLLYTILDLVFKTPKEGAQTTLHLCVAEELQHVTGKYFMECIEAEYSALADDDDLVERLWKESSIMCGLEPPAN